MLRLDWRKLAALLHPNSPVSITHASWIKRAITSQYVECGISRKVAVASLRRRGAAYAVSVCSRALAVLYWSMMINGGWVADMIRWTIVAVFHVRARSDTVRSLECLEMLRLLRRVRLAVRRETVRPCWSCCFLFRCVFFFKTLRTSESEYRDPLPINYANPGRRHESATCLWCEESTRWCRPFESIDFIDSIDAAFTCDFKIFETFWS